MWAGHEEDELRTTFGLENLKRRDHVENTNADGGIILKVILEKQGLKVKTGLVSVVFLAYHSVSAKCLQMNSSISK
jgi:hypothetical protein